MSSTDAEQVFVEALLRGVVAVERCAEDAVERAREALGGAADQSRADPFYAGAESAYVEGAACLAQLRVALGGRIGRAALTQALSAALSWMDADRIEALSSAGTDAPTGEAHHARGRAEAFGDLIEELVILRDAATRSMTVGSA
mgnify:CR=1 FL=1